MIPDIITALTPVADAFDALGIPYFIGGSVAAAYYGHERATNDIDLVADVHEAHAEALAARLQSAYYADAPMIRDAVRRQTSFNVIHFSTGLKVDVFAVRDTPYMHEQMQRRSLAVLAEESRTFPVASPEDTILAKVDWYRVGGEISQRQWDDIGHLLQAKHNTLDTTYMAHWASVLGLSDLLMRAWTEAGYAAP